MSFYIPELFLPELYLTDMATRKTIVSLPIQLHWIDAFDTTIFKVALGTFGFRELENVTGKDSIEIINNAISVLNGLTVPEYDEEDEIKEGIAYAKEKFQEILTISSNNQEAIWGYIH